MADREFSVILKATDLSSQPIREIIQSLNALKTAQAAFNAAAQEGKAVPKEFEANLKAMLAAAKAVSDQITSIERFVKVQNDHADKVERLAKAYQDLAAKQAEGPADDSKGAGNKFAKDIGAIEKTIKSLEKAVGSSSDALEKLRASLSNIGVNVQPDTQLLGLQRELTKALNERAAAQDRVNAKIASLPPEDERTKRQVYDLGRLEASAQKAQNRVDGLEGAIERYSGVKLNEAITQRLEEARGALASITTVTQDANKETLTLVQGYNAATKAAKDRADAERELAAAEAKSDEEFAARNRAERAAEQQRFGTPDKLGRLQGGEVEKATQAAAAVKEPDPRERAAMYVGLFDEIDAREKQSKQTAKQAGEDWLAFTRQMTNERVRVASQAEEKEAADDAAFVARQRARTAAEAEEGKKRIAAEQFAAETRANVRKADFQAAVDAQTHEEQLATARAENDKKQAARVEQLRDQQDKIAEAQAKLGATTSLGVSSDPAQQFSRLSESLSAILAPAEAARRTIEGVEKEVTSLGAALQGPRKRIEDYREDLRNLTLAMSGLTRIGGVVDTFKAQEVAVKRLDDELNRARADLGAMNELFNRGGVENSDLSARILRQSATVKQLETAHVELNNAFAATRAAAEAAGVDVNNLAATEAKLTEVATKARAAFQGLNTSAGGKSELNFLGLRPYELQNLYYQINDVFTQLASGTSITQTFSQQSGQIFQLFQKQLINGLATLKEYPGALAGIGVAFAVATVGVLAFIRAIDVAGERRRFAADLIQNVDGARYSINELVESAKGLERFGVTLDDASNGIRELVKAGASREQIRPLLELAANFANANNLKFPEALKQVATAFTGTGAELLKFTTEMNHLLDINQFRAVKDAIEDGRIVEARALAMAAIFGKIEEAATKNTTAIVKAFRELKTAFQEFLDSVSSNRVVNAFGSDLIKFLGEAVLLARDLFNLMDSISRLEFRNAGRAIMGQQPEREQSIAPAGQQGASTPGQKPGETEDFIKQRDAAADLAGIARESYRILQQSEGVWDAKLNKWVDVINGGQGPAQVLRTTFDDLKRRYPELIKGDVHDIQSNLNAGALYLREMAEKANNSFTKTVEGYKQGPDFAFGTPQQRMAAASSIPPDRFFQNARSVQQIGSLYSGPVVLGPVGGPAQPQVSTNAQQIATDQFKKDEADRRRASEEAYADEQRRYALFVEDLRKSDEEVNKRAQEAASKVGAPKVSDDQLVADRAAARLELWRKYEEGRAQRTAETQRKLDEIEQKGLEGDKTNADARIRISNQQFDARKRELELDNQRGRFPPAGGADEFGNRVGGGKTFQQALDELERSREQANANIVIDTAKAIVDQAVKERDARLREIQEQLNRPGANIPALLAQQAAVRDKFLPIVEKAVEDSNKALDRANKLQGGQETETVRAERARNEAVRQGAQRPDIIDRSVTQGTGIVQEGQTSAIQVGKAQIDTIADSVKLGAASATDAINHITEVGKQWVNGLRDTTRTTNEALRAILPTATPAEQAKLKAEIERNGLAPIQAAVDVQNAILAAVNETKAKLDKLLEEYKRAMEDIDKRLLDRRIDAITAATERAAVRARLLPGITAAGQDVRSAVGAGQQAAGTLGLSPTFRADLSAIGQTAATTANPATITNQDYKKQADDLRLLAHEAQSTASETARTQSELLKLHATTQTAAEEAVKEAYAAANVELDKQEPAVRALIKAMEDVGNTQGAKKLAADWQLVRAQMTYVDPLIQQIETGFEQSFASRAMTYIDGIAKAVGNLAVGAGKLSDVWRAVGLGFANMTAGILEDVAKIIIKYELLKLINDALGTDIPTGGAGSGNSSGGGGAGSAAGGVLGILGKLFGLGGGGAAGSAASTFGAAGVEAGAMTGAEAGFASAGFLLHSGGTVGDPTGMSRPVDVSVFHEAQRYHDGGMVGLRHDEVPIIAERGEKIISLAEQRQQRDAANAAKSAQPTGIRNVLAVGDREIANAMNSSHGEKTILNVLQRNAPTVKKYVG